MQETKNSHHEIYLRAAGAVAFIAVETFDKMPGLGSCFHIGEGIFITARHVVERTNIIAIATTKSVRLGDEARGKVVPPRRLKLIDGPHYGPDDLDIAIFKVDLAGNALPSISVSAHTEFDLDEHDFILRDVVIIGYPRVPMTTVPVQVATIGQINAVVRLWHSSASRFLVSTMARGGFSGGVALNQNGQALALVTESLGEAHSLAETGYTSLLSISPAVDLAAERYGYNLYGFLPGRDTEDLIGFRFQTENSASLSSYAYDASVYVYDDNRDVLVQITCESEEALKCAIAAFDSVTPLRKEDSAPDRDIFFPAGNPPPKLLIAAAEAARDALIRVGYRVVVEDRSNWQVDTWGEQ